ncbi:hypothetical protein NHH03_10500 [Stieleria sp. TO1_6]|uniref:hypothetical protein n=1 Tax=Stieleria tagensis TaxID=2956795 RepID=UPI00209AC37D|nr:hypothetical protein [Stieleria tagensis]MCO8122168.1 hypothetical protein [Stieleria tagensis]
MSVWIDRILLLALILVVALLTITALPFFAGQTLGGQTLLIHMMASGVLVVGLPLFALVFLRHLRPSQPASKAQQAGYLATIATGLLTILTVLACMLPIASTEQMHVLMETHGWAGLAMIPAIGLLLIGMRAKRSASHLHS